MIFQTDSSSYRVISRITAGFTAGGMAAAIATPTELLKVRAQEGFQIEQLHPIRSLLLQEQIIELNLKTSLRVMQENRHRFLNSLQKLVENHSK